jgi:DNA-directed RNA polymerase subunit RPC12/RpoP
VLGKFNEGSIVDDLFDEFIEYDFVVGADVVKCPHCGVDVPRSLFFDNEVECLECGKKITRLDKKQ